MVFKAKSFPIALTLVIAKDTISDKFSYCWHLLYFCRIILRLTKSSDMTFRVIKLKRHGLIIFLCFVYFIFIEFCNMMFTMSIFFSACIYRSYAHFVALNKRFILVTCHHSATLENIHPFHSCFTFWMWCLCFVLMVGASMNRFNKSVQIVVYAWQGIFVGSASCLMMM